MNATDEAYWTTLHIASKIGTLLLERSANLNLRDQNNQTSLYLVCKEGFGDCALVLIENGGDITLENAEKKTPLNLCKKGVKSFYFITNFNRGINSC
ncbi:26S proteasome non-ATPase regulatory subunit 10 [Gigaspora margarita]|uniref:26S proteasome non-ATPase regulatory subunit 10 n=1 Tax=Gigaspora margarita TaxID=4874 RepID=A0A8H4A252_GIGMA|nr:26S proteasome non-ATPase regulatory subunit 10 [Gigaspora margarita]